MASKVMVIISTAEVDYVGSLISNSIKEGYTPMVF
jgi:hypothetical protein